MGDMNISSLVAGLIKDGIHLSVSDENLVLKGDLSQLGKDVKQSIVNNKQEIIRYLRAFSLAEDIPHVDRRTVTSLPLSPVQKGIWTFHQIAGKNSQYNMPYAFRVNGAFDVARAELAIKKIMARHEVLRTRYLESEGEAFQFIETEADFAIEKILLESFSENEIRKLLQRELAYTFNIEEEIPIRVCYACEHSDSTASGLLIFNIHHIAADAWSMGILLREFVEFYSAEKEGRPSNLPDLELQYADYAYHQQQLNQSQAFKAHCEYWKNQLDAAPLTHSLPLDFPRPANKSHEAGSVEIDLDGSTLEKLEKYASQQGITLFMLLHGALAILVSRFSGENDIVLGSSVANRKARGLDALIGLFVNNLVLRSHCGHESLQDFWAHIKDVNLKAQEHQDVGLAEIVELANIHRSASYTPIYQIVLTMNNHDIDEIELPGLEINGVDMAQSVAKYDLEINAQCHGDKLRFCWWFDKSIFTEAKVKAFSRYLVHILENVIKPGVVTEDQVFNLREEDRDLLFKKFNKTVQRPAAIPLYRQFENAVAYAPEDIAVEYEGRSLNYSELNRYTNQLADFLLEEGVAPGDLLLLPSVRSLELVIAILAIHKVGAAYVPVDISQPLKRIVTLVNECTATRALCWGDNIKTFSLPNLEAINIEDILDGGFDVYSAENPEISEATVDTLAYVIFTSGSTGIPKGVAVSNRQLCNYLEHCKKNYFNHNLVGAVVSTPLHFDATVTSLLSPLTLGKRIRLLPNANESMLSALISCLFTADANWLYKLTPAHLRLVEGADPVLHAQNEHLLVIGGEQLSYKGLKTWVQQFLPNALYVNEYGPTEATVGCCIYVVDKHNWQDKSGAIPIGKPIDNVNIFVLDKYQRMLPVDADGEMYISGASLAQGYINRPELSKEKFIDPVPAIGERAYKTGDKVRLLPDGDMLYLDRLDNQIKIRGYRIELSEIETCIEACENIDSAVVIVYGEDKNKIAAFVKIKTEQAGAVDSELAPKVGMDKLGEEVSQALPAYMLPDIYIQIESWPLTTNGKIDKKKLEEGLHGEALTNKPRRRQPINETEATLLEIWRSVFHKTEIDLEDDLFSLGGDSITAIQIVARANKLGIKLSTAELFQYQSIAALAPHIKSEQTRPVNNTQVEGRIPLLPSQREFISLNADLKHYNQSLVFSVPDKLNRKHLQDMLAVLIQQHDGLRLRLLNQTEAVFSTFDSFEECIAIEELDVPTLESAEYKGAVDQAQTSLNPYTDESGKGGLIGKILLVHSGDGSYLFWVLHHFVIDGVSWRILLEDLQTLWQQVSAGEDLRLANKGHSLKAWSHYLQSEAYIARFGEEADFWTQQANTNPPALKASAATDKKWHAIDLDFSEALSNRFRNIQQVKANDLLVSSLVVALSDIFEANSIAITLESHGREPADAELDINSTVGWFTSMYPLNFDIAHCDNLAKKIASIKSRLQSIALNGAGFSQHALQGLRSATGVLFNYLGQFNFGQHDTDQRKPGQGDALDRGQGSFSLAQAYSGKDIPSSWIREEQLSFNGALVNNKLAFRIEYNRKVISDELANDIAARYHACFCAVIDACESPQNHTVFFSKYDFPLANLDDEELTYFKERYRFDDIYPATPMQSGILYQSALNRGVYVNQLLIDMENIKLDIFKRSWEILMTRHDILNTYFVLSSQGYLQFKGQSTLRIEEVDLRAYPDSIQSARVEEACTEDKEQDFELDHAPLMRLQLFRLSEKKYRLLWSHHHVLWDGWSNAILLEELLDIYSSLQKDLGPLSRYAPKYLNFVAWLQDQDQGTAESFWKKNLSDCGSPSPFPQKHNEGPAELLSYELDLGPQLRQGLEKLARQEQVTLSTIIHSAWAILLAIYTGEEDVVFGSVFSGRPPSLTGVEKTVGLFINSLPLTAKIERRLGVNTLFNRMQEKYLEVETYSYFSLQGIQDLFGGGPLFDTLLVFENYPVSDKLQKVLDDVELKISDLQVKENTHYGITVIAENTDKLHFKLQADSRFYDAHLCQSLLPNLRLLLESMQARAGIKVGELPHIFHKDLHAFYSEFNNTEVALPNSRCLHELFLTALEKFPDNIAVTDSEGSMSYRELYTLSLRLLKEINKTSPSPETLIAIRLNRGRGQVAASLAVMMAGCAWLPLEVSWPVERCEDIAAQANLHAVLVDHDDLALPGIASLNINCLPQEETSATAADIQATATNALAYVIYTSGSTGKPKGVAIEHQSAVNTILDIIEKYGLHENDKIIALSALSFDLSVFDIFGALALGAEIVCLEQANCLDPAHWLEVAHKHQVTFWNSVPVSVKLLVERIEMTKQEAPPLRNILMSGDWIDPKLPKRLFKLFPQANVYSLGGATEGSIWSIHHPIVSDTTHLRSVPYGKPLGNQSFYIVGSSGQLLPFGFIGELCIGGIGVAREYYKNPELSDAQFYYDTGLNQRLYRTGDLGRFTDEGYIEFIGRKDGQVKINGFRVELGEIEQKILQDERIESTVVLARRSEEEGDFLCAYLQLNMGSEGIEEQTLLTSLKQKLREQLPVYMLPSAFVFVQEWPLTANGKVNTKALPVVDYREYLDDVVLASSETEIWLTDLWSELTGVASTAIAVNRGFQEIGGNSLTLIRFAAALESHCNYKLSIAEIYETATLQKLAQTIDRQQKHSAVTENISALQEDELEEFSF